MGDLEDILRDELKNPLATAGNELVLPYSEALRAIGVASQHHVAVLGLELFEIRKDGLQTVDFSGYGRDISADDWKTYVAKMNGEAEIWIKAHLVERNHGYILTSASERELADAKLRLEKS